MADLYQQSQQNVTSDTSTEEEMENRYTTPPDIQPPAYQANDPNATSKAPIFNAQNYGPQYYPPPGPQPIMPPGVTSATPGAVLGSTVVIHTTGFGQVPVTVTCGHCHQVVTSRTQYVSGTCTWMLCCILFIFFLPFFCWLIPFCMVGTKDVYHYCPLCHHVLGIHYAM